MTMISVELVPRSEASLKNESRLIKYLLPSVTTINIPDLPHFYLRSWDGACATKEYFKHSIPHIRAIDFELKDDLPIAEFLQKNDISSVLVVNGDKPQWLTRNVYDTTSIDMIRLIKRRIPDMHVYAALDQYRNSIKKEIDYAKEKINAGADGFFTQPFFDLRLMEMYAEQLKSSEVFYGVSPVCSGGAKQYWEKKNNAVFPEKFYPCRWWNKIFAKKALDFVKERNANIYFMPIKIDALDYLLDVLG